MTYEELLYYELNALKQEFDRGGMSTEEFIELQNQIIQDLDYGSDLSI